MGTTALQAAEPEEALVLERLLDAPREKVFRAWTDPALMKRWWSPEGYTTPRCTIDLRVGGTCHSCMRSPEGLDIWGVGTYLEIVEPERLVLTDHFADETGRVVSPTVYDMPPEWPEEAVITATFEDRGGKTLLTVRHAVPLALAGKMNMREGWSQCIDKLERVLAGG